MSHVEAAAFDRAEQTFRTDVLECGWRVGRFTALEEMEGLAHAVTLRETLDVQLIRRDRPAVAARLAAALAAESVAWADQVHGADVRAVDAPGPAGEADALITVAPGLLVMGVSADCPLILLADPDKRTAGVVHASWRGTVRRIAEHGVRALRETFHSAPESLVAAICPSAGPCCYEVGEEVRREAGDGIGPQADAFFERREDGLYFDLWAANAAQLLGAGLRPARIHLSEVCTLCRNDLLPSHRAEGERAGRFCAAVGWRP